jgi:hypothetical protein
MCLQSLWVVNRFFFFFFFGGACKINIHYAHLKVTKKIIHHALRKFVGVFKIWLKKAKIISNKDHVERVPIVVITMYNHHMNTKETLDKQGVCHTVALPITLKSILKQKKNYGNSNISPCKNIIFKKPSKRKTKILQDIIAL